MVGRCTIVVALLAAIPCFAQFPTETERLMSTARLWVTVEYFHPYLANSSLDWDKALVSTLPRVREAKSTAEFRAALSGMLADTLADPETCILPEGRTACETRSEAGPSPLSIVMSAHGASLLFADRSETEKILLDLPGMTACVRLSEPLSNKPVVSGSVVLNAKTSTDAYPDTEHRLLAAIKTWGAIHYFFAYKDLMDEDWDEVFAASLSKFIDAKDATDYNLSLSDLLTHLTDTNTAPHSKLLNDYFGEAPVGLRIRLLDKYPIITDVLDPAAVALGVKPGDVLKRIGSESVTDRFRRFVQYIPASTPQRSGYDTVQRVTNGPAGSEIELAIENSQGEARPIKLVRRSMSDLPQRTTEPVRILAGNIGYLDLDRLKPEEANQALDRLKDTKALIFDLRGKAPSAVEIASHLTADANSAVALETTPIALHPDVPTSGIATQTASTFVVKTLARATAPLYRGKTAALIDERTIGEAEYAGLLFEAANKTDFVGAPSAGAESSIVELPLPGGVTVTYSSQDIRHANGGKLQRLGLQPTVSAPTTAKGLRAGKDEPLEAAIAHLSH